jgi:uracil-DNA glycosylase family 4
MTPQPPSVEDPRALLRWYVESGVEDIVEDAPFDRYAASLRPAVAAASSTAPASPPPTARGVAERPLRQAPPPSFAPVSVATPPFESPQLIEDARALAARCTTLDELEAAVRAFDGCALKRTANKTVFADGARGAPVMVVGEAPGADEDRQGKPFVGKSGQLMDRMFAAIGMSRETNLYITNVVLWRPPGNRTPSSAEIAMCVAFLRRHIQLARPKVLVIAGGTPLKALYDANDGIMRARGRWRAYDMGDGATIPALPTLHPAGLLRATANKRFAWKDLLILQDKLRELETAP